MERGNGDNPSPAVELLRDDGGLFLRTGGMELRCDLERLAPRTAPGRLEREPLVRAARVKGATAPRAIDATAGLGEDAFLLAAAGFTVELHEHNPLVAALLRDGLSRAASASATTEAAARMHLHEDDGLAALQALSGGGSAPDVVYLDPMFPERTKSAAVKKKAQLLQRLEPPATDEQAARLLRAALRTRARKVVVKRPPKGPALAGPRPAYSLASKAVRFDVYVPANLGNGLFDEGEPR